MANKNKTKKQSKVDRFNWYLSTAESCPCCGYTEGYVNTRKEQEQSSYPNYFTEKFKTKKELKKYCKDNSIDIDT